MIQLIVVPYDSGRRSYRMGRGPEHLLASGLVEQLAAVGLTSNVSTIETEGDQIDAAFDIAHQVAAATHAAVDEGAFPVILAGNCIATLGGLAGLKSHAALLWLDAHADLNTPETSPSGFLDGMALAVITGRCHVERSNHVAGFEPLPDSELVLLGTRSVDDGEAPIVEKITRARNPSDVRRAISRLQRSELYLHLDLDVLDPSALRANQFATTGGLDTGTMLDCITEAAHQKPIVALAITAYDPDADAANAGPHIVVETLRRVILHPGR